MVHSIRTLGSLAIVGFLAGGLAAQTPAAKPDPAKGGGVVPLAAQTSLVIRGIPGQIVISAKPTRELRYISKAKDKSGGDRPIAVALSDTTVTMTAPPGAALADGILRVEAPASFSVKVEAAGGTVGVDGFSGAVVLVGKGTVVRAQALAGTLDAGVEGGSLSITNLSGPAIARLAGASTFSATDVRGGLDVTSRDATFKVQGNSGAFRLDARGGSGDVTGLGSGGELRLSECALRLTGGKGEVTVTSDAAVEFSNMTASLRFEMEGGTLYGKGNQGSVRVRARRTEVKLEGITGEVDLDTTNAVVLVQKIIGPVTAILFGADAQLLELQGALHLDIGGGNAEVGWGGITGDADSVLKSNNGSLIVRFPVNASCRVTARSSAGLIVSDIPTIKVPAGATEIQGALGQGQRPTIEIEAEGSVHLTTGSKSPAGS